MKHLNFNPTPVNKLEYYSKKLGVNLICKRDDLFAEAGGGNKARMLQYILADVNPKNCDVLVTAGAPCSNFNRACALMCAKLGVLMHLVEYSDKPEEFVTFIAVKERYRGNGIAGNLLDKACEFAKRNGMSLMGIDTNNIIARDCYIKNGFKLIESHKIENSLLERFYLEKTF